MCYAGPGSWANQASAVALESRVSEAEFDRLVEFYVSRGAEPRINVCPFVDPSLPRELERRRFVVVGFENVMARAIEPEEDLTPPRRPPADLEIVRVDPGDDEMVRAWVEVSASGFLAPGQSMTPNLIEIGERVVRHLRCETLVAYLGGEAVGAAGMETIRRFLTSHASSARASCPSSVAAASRPH